MNLFPEEILNLPVYNCPHCGSIKFIKFGKYKNVSRYRCKECHRTFIPTSGTSIHYINKKDIFIKYFEILKSDGLIPLRTMSEILGISLLTAFDWRHKILLAFQNDRTFKENIFHSNILLNFNEKGRRGSLKLHYQNNILFKKKNLVKVFSLSDTKKISIRTVRIGKFDIKDFDRLLKNKIQNNVQVLTISKITNVSKLQYCNVRKLNKIEKNNVSSILKNHNSNSLEFKQLINTFLHGVATKYLQIYANYYSYIHSFEKLPNIRELLKYNTSWKIFIKMEYFYLNLLKNYSNIKQTVCIKRSWKTNFFNLMPDFTIL